MERCPDCEYPVLADGGHRYCTNASCDWCAGPEPLNVLERTMAASIAAARLGRGPDREPPLGRAGQPLTIVVCRDRQHFVHWCWSVLRNPHDRSIVCLSTARDADRLRGRARRRGDRVVYYSPPLQAADEAEIQAEIDRWQARPVEDGGRGDSAVTFMTASGRVGGDTHAFEETPRSLRNANRRAAYDGRRTHLAQVTDESVGPCVQCGGPAELPGDDYCAVWPRCRPRPLNPGLPAMGVSFGS